MPRKFKTANADASKSKVVSYKRLIELEAQVRQEVNELFQARLDLTINWAGNGLYISNRLVSPTGC